QRAGARANREAACAASELVAEACSTARAAKASMGCDRCHRVTAAGDRSCAVCEASAGGGRRRRQDFASNASFTGSRRDSEYPAPSTECWYDISKGEGDRAACFINQTTPRTGSASEGTRIEG